jgi:hypothetical protein
MSDGVSPCLHLPKKPLTISECSLSETLKPVWKINIGILGSKLGKGEGECKPSVIIIIHLLGLAPAGYVTAPDNGPRA